MDKLKRLLQGRKATSVEKTPQDVYNEVSEKTGMPVDEVASIGGVESEHGKYNKPLQGGVARGLFQFQPETAEHLIPGSTESIDDMNTQAELMSKYLNQTNQDTSEDSYAMHNLGPTRAKKFLAAHDNALVSSVIPARVIRGNPGIYDVKTVGEARRLIKKKLEAGEDSADLQPNIEELFKEQYPFLESLKEKK
jgi:hypothetical protein